MPSYGAGDDRRLRVAEQAPDDWGNTTTDVDADGYFSTFSAEQRRQVQTLVVNGDFALAPPAGVNSAINSDSGDDEYNPLPGWKWVRAADNSPSLYYIAEPLAASGYGLGYSLTAVDLGGAYLEQLVPIPMSQGQQYRIVASIYSKKSGLTLATQFLQLDASTAIGSEIVTAISPLSETKVDLGLVPTLGSWVRLRITCGIGPVDNGVIYEVRCAAIPTETVVGLESLSAATGAITNTQTQVIGHTIPADSLTAGQVWRVKAYGVCTSSVANAVTFRIRIGPTTLIGNIAASQAITATTTASANGFSIDGLFTVRDIGATGHCLADFNILGANTQPFSVPLGIAGISATVAVDTTVANILELTAVTAAATTSVNFQQAIWECVRA